MTIVFVLLSLILAIGLAVGWELLRVRRAAEGDFDPDQLMAKLSGLHVYDPMRRLLCDDDFVFVRNQVLSDREKRRFRRRRRTATVAYLKDIRADFSRIWTVCRLLTPLNPDPNFSIVLLRQWVVFHGYYAVGQSCCEIGCLCWMALDFSGLTRNLKQLGTMASDTLRLTDAMVSEAARSDAS